MIAALRRLARAARTPAVLDALITFTCVVMFLAFVIGLGGCGSRPRVIEKPVIVPKVERCSGPAGAPPAWVPITAPGVCKSGFVCLPRVDAAALASNIGRLRAWAAQVGELCAPSEVK